MSTKAMKESANAGASILGLTVKVCTNVQICMYQNVQICMYVFYTYTDLRGVIVLLDCFVILH